MSVINHRLQTMVSNPLLLKSRRMNQTDKQARRCPRQSIALSVYEAPTLPLSIDDNLLLITPVLNAFILADAAYPSHDDTVSPHESDFSTVHFFPTKW